MAQTLTKCHLLQKLPRFGYLDRIVVEYYVERRKLPKTSARAIAQS